MAQNNFLIIFYYWKGTLINNWVMQRQFTAIDSILIWKCKWENVCCAKNPTYKSDQKHSFLSVAALTVSKLAFCTRNCTDASSCVNIFGKDKRTFEDIRSLCNLNHVVGMDNVNFLTCLSTHFRILSKSLECFLPTSLLIHTFDVPTYLWTAPTLISK